MKHLSDPRSKTKRRSRRRRSTHALAKKIEKVVLREGFVTVPQLRAILGDNWCGGGLTLCDVDDYNIVYWIDASAVLRRAINRLVVEERIEACFVSPGLHLLTSGEELALPYAAHPTKEGYRSPHWLPLVLAAPGTTRRRQALFRRGRRRGFDW
jgi:hypothetical protein